MPNVNQLYGTTVMRQDGKLLTVVTAAYSSRRGIQPVAMFPAHLNMGSGFSPLNLYNVKKFLAGDSVC